LDVVEELDCGDGDAGADDAEDALGGSADGGEGGDGDARVLGQGGDFQNGFGDEAEGAFAADEGARKVVASAAFAGPLPRLEDGAVGHDDGEAEDPVAHGAVAIGICAGAAGADHTANHSAGAGVRGKEEAVVC